MYPVRYCMIVSLSIKDKACESVFFSYFSTRLQIVDSSLSMNVNFLSSVHHRNQLYRVLAYSRVLPRPLFGRSENHSCRCSTILSGWPTLLCSTTVSGGFTECELSTYHIHFILFPTIVGVQLAWLKFPFYQH